MRKYRIPPFRSDSKLALDYQAEWAAAIRAQGRDPCQRFPVAEARALRLARRPSIPRTPLRLPARAFIPLDADRSFVAGASYCQQGATVVAFNPRGVGRVAVKEAA